jgi:hypothetical protein
VRVQFEFLTPAVQHAEEADFRAEMLGIACDFQKGFRTGAKQEIVDDLLVLQDQWSQPVGQCEDNMDVTRWEKLLAPRCEPAIASSCLTLRAVPISARVVGDSAMSTASAFIEMAAERSCATPCNRQQHFDMFPTDPLAVSLDKGSSSRADEIGNLERRRGQWSTSSPT